jgi:hypothetical protein
LGRWNFCDTKLLLLIAAVLIGVPFQATPAGATSELTSSDPFTVKYQLIAGRKPFACQHLKKAEPRD